MRQAELESVNITQLVVIIIVRVACRCLAFESELETPALTILFWGVARHAMQQ